MTSSRFTHCYQNCRLPGIGPATLGHPVEHALRSGDRYETDKKDRPGALTVCPGLGTRRICGRAWQIAGRCRIVLRRAARRLGLVWLSGVLPVLPVVSRLRPCAADDVHPAGGCAVVARPAIRLLVLLRGCARVLPVREGMSGRLAAGRTPAFELIR